MGMVVSNLSIALIGIAIAFFYGWELTLVTLISMPLTIVSTGALGKIQTSLTSRELAAYAVCGGIAEEIISAIRTVVAFGGQKKELERFQAALNPARQIAIKRGLYAGITSGLIWFLIYGTYAVAFWYSNETVIIY